jgi:hypothetical protein
MERVGEVRARRPWGERQVGGGSYVVAWSPPLMNGRTRICACVQ